MTDPVADVIGVALVGCAHIPHAKSYARSLVGSPTAHLVGVYDADPELGRSVAEQFGVEFVADAAALIGRDDVQAVVVCSATVEHRALVELAASLGRHVLCEKPIATTVEDAQAMIDACAAADVQLHTAFVTRFYPLVQQIKAAIESGSLGEIVALVGGNRGTPPLPPRYPAWITTTSESGGGALIDHSVHVTDIMRHVSGREVASVNAEVDSLFHASGVDDMALVSLRFDSGAIGSVDPSWSVPAGNPWDYDFYLRVLGTKGAASIDDLAESVNMVSSGSGTGNRLVPFGIDIDADMVEAFIESVRTNTLVVPCADGVDGLRALEIALAAYSAADAGAWVTLPVDAG
ncbi:MAG: putative dehydrogenase [Ilumatobacteraceae bacterium]|nr:putative dehydrogenase [Ilumatobacteraceae bacterium]